MAVLVYHDKKGNTGAWVLEEKEEYYIDIPPSKFIDQACKYYGASLKGRQEGTRNIYWITNRAPICIDPSSGMSFLPTASPVYSNCSWIAHSHIIHANQLKNRATDVIFRYGRKVSLQV